VKVSEGARCLGEHRFYVENFFDETTKTVHVIKACTACPYVLSVRVNLKEKRKS